MSEIVKEEVIPELSFGKRPRTRIYVSDNIYYGKVTGVLTDRNIHDENAGSDYKIETIHINNTPVDITIMGRDGLAVTLKAKPDIKNPKLTIRKIIVLKRHSLQSAVKCLSSMSEVETSDLEVMKKALEGTRPGEYSDIKILLDYVIEKDDLSYSKNFSIYHQQTDLVISLKDVLHIPNHPYSARFMDIGNFGITYNYEHIDRDNLQIKIKYVNHSPHASVKYTNVFGRVFCLHPESGARHREIRVFGANKKRDLVYTDYVEIISTCKNDARSKANVGVKVERFSLEEAKELLGLYDTYAEADANGNIDLVRKRELATLQHKHELEKQSFLAERAGFEADSDRRKKELSDQTLELQREKNKVETRNLEMDRKQKDLDVQIQDLKNTKTMLDIRSNMLNFGQEIQMKEMNFKQQQRKETVDIIKFIPSTLIAIGGLIGLYAKFSNKN